MNYLYKLFTVSIASLCMFLMSKNICAQDNVSILFLYSQQQSAITNNDTLNIQLLNKQLIELNERPDLLFVKKSMNNNDFFEFIPAIDYPLADINKLNSRLKNAIPELIEIKKISSVLIQVEVINSISLDNLKLIFSVFKYKYN